MNNPRTIRILQKCKNLVEHSPDEVQPKVSIDESILINIPAESISNDDYCNTDLNSVPLELIPSNDGVSEEYNIINSDDNILFKSGTFIIDEQGELVELFETSVENDNLELELPINEVNVESPAPNQQIQIGLNQNNEQQIINEDANTPVEEENHIPLLEVTQQDENSEVQKRKRRKRHQVNENDWECKQSKILREQGKEYIGRKVINGKVTEFVKRPKREMKDITCKCLGKTFQCRRLSETDKKNIFAEFWRLSWNERKVFIRSMTDINLTQRTRDRLNESSSRRNFSFKFHLRLNNEKIRVCKKSLLATLGVGEWMVNKWLQVAVQDDNLNEVEGTDKNKPNDEGENNHKHTKKSTRQEDLSKRFDLLKEFLMALPKVESHYCRSSSTKLYLESSWTSKSQLFQFYCENWCQEKKCKPLSSCTFYKSFEDLNLSLYRPKKDECDLCRAYKLKNISDETYNEHLKKKTAARDEKNKDKINEDNVYTVDLQSLLLSPKSNSSALYYRRKLSVHNLCIYDLKSHDGYCYLWNESEGELTANEFASILTHFIESQLPLKNNGNKLIIYSDGCNYQNRSAVLSNALLHLALKHNITIESKYLEKGHTQMECDSMHSIIERYLRQREIHVPADYVEICKNARKCPRPFKVNYLDHTFF